MNRALSFLLVLFPGMLVAQSNPQSSPSSPTVNATLITHTLPAPVGESPVRPRRALSTGITFPRLVHIAPIVAPGRHVHLTAKKLLVVVAYTVDESGAPFNAYIVESANPALDEEVLAAVAQFHYVPGTLDGEPTPFPMMLRYILDRGAEY